MVLASVIPNVMPLACYSAYIAALAIEYKIVACITTCAVAILRALAHFFAK